MASDESPAGLTPEEAARLLPAVLAAMPCAVAVASGQEDRIMAANAAWRNLAALHRGAGAPGTRLDHLFPGAPVLLTEALLANGAVVRLAMPAAAPLAGKPSWWDLDVVPHPEFAGATIIIARDVTLAVLTAGGAAPRAVAAERSGFHGYATILLAAGDDQVRPMTTLFLTELGYTVTEAAAPTAAAAAAPAEAATAMPRPDLLIADASLPENAGFALAASLRARFAGLPVLFMAGRVMDERLDHEIVLRKPFSSAALSRAVLHALGRAPGPIPEHADYLLSRLRTPSLRAFALAWFALRGENPTLPSPGSIRPEDFDLEPHAFLAAVAAVEPVHFRYRSVGAALSARFGATLAGAETRSAVTGEDVIGPLEDAYRRCVKTASPTYQSARFDFGDGPPTHFERLILPMSADGQGLTHLLGIVLFDDAVAGRKA